VLVELDVAADGVAPDGDVAADVELHVAADRGVLQERHAGALALNAAVDEHAARVELRAVAELDVAIDAHARLEHAARVVGHAQVLDLAPVDPDVAADVHRHAHLLFARQLRGRRAERRGRRGEGHGTCQDGRALACTVTATATACQAVTPTAATAATGGDAEREAQCEEGAAGQAAASGWIEECVLLRHVKLRLGDLIAMPPPSRAACNGCDEHLSPPG